MSGFRPDSNISENPTILNSLSWLPLLSLKKKKKLFWSSWRWCWQHLTKSNCCLCSACFLATNDLPVSICQVSLRQTWKKSPPSYTGTLKPFLCQILKNSFCWGKIKDLYISTTVTTLEAMHSVYEAVLRHPSQPVITTLHHEAVYCWKQLCSSFSFLSQRICRMEPKAILDFWGQWCQ